MQGATDYTITATNAAGTATQTFTLRITAQSCAPGFSCTLGVDTGPGGGIVFYAAVGTFASPGSTCNTAGVGGISTCKYLEAAPSDQSSGSVWATLATSCYDDDRNSSNEFCSSHTIYPGNSAAQDASRTAATAIGMGMANTNQAYARLTTFGGALTTSYAAGIAWAYTNNRQTDWFLPSKGELNELWQYKTQVGGFASGKYWSSTEQNVGFVWVQGFEAGSLSPDYFWKGNTYYVRPVRAF